MSDSDSPAKRPWRASRRGKQPRKKGLQFFTDVRLSGESIVDCIIRISEIGILIDTFNLTESISILKQEDIQSSLILQYQVAKRKGNWAWIKGIRKDSQFVVSNAWIDQHMPSLDGRKLKLPRRQSPLDEMNRLLTQHGDIRLQKDPSLPVYRSNAMEDDTLDLTSGEPSGSKVTAPCYQEEVKMETTPVPEDRPAETVSVEAAVQPTIASLPLAPIRKATDVTRNALSSASGNPPVRKQSKRKDYGESSFHASSDGSQELASQSSPTRRVVLPSRASKRVLSITVRSEPDQPTVGARKLIVSQLRRYLLVHLGSNHSQRLHIVR